MSGMWQLHTLVYSADKPASQGCQYTTVWFAPMAKRLTAPAWIDFARATLAREGFEALKAEALACKLGVSRGSFYWHFEDIETFHARVIEQWRQVATEAIIAVIAQPISPLLVPAGHEVAAIGVVDDFYDGDFANVWCLSRSGLSSKTLHAMLSLLFDMGHQLPLANTHSRQGRLIAILASDTPSAGNPIMAHNEGAPALPSLGSAIRRLQAIGHTIASKSGAYNNLGHRGQYAG